MSWSIPAYICTSLGLISEALQVQKLVRVQFAGFSIEMGFQHSVIALQRNEVLHHKFKVECSAYSPEMFVFIDETGSDRKNARRMFGYSLVGKTPSASRLLVRGKCFSAITALSLDGVLDTHITPNTVTGDTFLEFVETKLLLKVMPFDGANPQSIIVMDNDASIHHVYPVIEALEDAGCLLLFLPPYSPDLNLIGECFLKVKSQLRS